MGPSLPQVVKGDGSLWRLFEQECYSYEPGTGLGLPPHMQSSGRSATARRSCVSDEHYFPTLLAVAGRQNEVGAGPRGVPDSGPCARGCVPQGPLVVQSLRPGATRPGVVTPPTPLGHAAHRRAARER